MSEIRKVGAWLPVSRELFETYEHEHGDLGNELLAIMSEDLEYPTATSERRAEIDANRRRRTEVAARADVEREERRRAEVEDRIAELRVEHERDPEAFFRRVAEGEQEVAM